jgi:hypothetical protein
VGTESNDQWSSFYGSMRLACCVDYLRPPLTLTFKDAAGKLIPGMQYSHAFFSVLVSYCGAASAFGLKVGLYS